MDAILPAQASSKRRTVFRSEVVACLLTCVCLLAAVAGFVGWRFGSIGAGLAYARGTSLLPDSGIKEVGEVGVNESTTFSYTLRNLAGRPIRLQGSQMSCSCAVVEGIPRTIEPAGSSVVTVTVHAGSKPEPLDGSFQLFTDNPAEPELVLGYRGRVVATAGGMKP